MGVTVTERAPQKSRIGTHPQRRAKESRATLAHVPVAVVVEIRRAVLPRDVELTAELPVRERDGDALGRLA